MLVLQRKTLEQIVIGNDVIITITDIDRGRVKIGISAPDGKRIFRSELLTPEQMAAVKANIEGKRT